ncbi:hypothetical protein [Quadrisphaera sp. DSM 44207]|uniref:hypothetical protein n=1 Tax=Quadrisphaera sp. DSM 44207 TaxID=1881057 RepID=UPI00115F7B29|nr:hypothetical protein [Quadrisphaera sp. DSM 44207]
MRTRPAPLRGAVVADRDRPGRALRVPARPEAGLVVLSAGDGARRTSTVRVAPGDVPLLVAALSGAAVADVLPAVC